MVSIVTVVLNGIVLGSNLGNDKRSFSSPKHPDQAWGPPSLLYKRTGVLSRD
jgi:hypothetical protein